MSRKSIDMDFILFVSRYLLVNLCLNSIWYDMAPCVCSKGWEKIIRIT